MKLIKIEVYIFLLFLTIINLIAVVTSVEYMGSDYNVKGTLQSLAVITIVAAGFQIFSSIIFIIIPRKGSRILFFLQLLITLAFFASATGYFMHLNLGQFMSFWQIFPSVEGLNGLAGIWMLLILGREGWGDILSEDYRSKDANYLQTQNSLPRFAPPPQHPQQPYGYGGPNKPY